VYRKKLAPVTEAGHGPANALNGAFANVGPVKVGVASANLASGSQGQVTPGTSGRAIYGLPTGQPENHCASLCGYGLLAA
jgi:hypothetical protein